ncbi:transposon Ty3-I Gag-Pol polyprotein [Trichonephila clavipes]|nr:transposon Ty3-I Gag-Pol polyprotein [Trichonephila clavipes]
MATPETAAVVIPPFIQRDPALWFYMIESTFELASPKPITESKTKYNYAVSHLPPDIATVVRDVIIQPDISDPYSELKAKIIERCSENKTQEIRRLLATMPVPVQTILASISPITSDKASEVADRILAISPHAINAVSASGASPSSVTDRRSSMDMLLDEVKALRKEVADLRRYRSQFRHNNNVRRKRSNSRSNLRHKRLIDCVTNLKVPAKLGICSIFSVKSVYMNNVYGKLLLKYPELTKLPDINQPVKHNTMHFINTKGPPVAAKPRRLAQTGLKLQKPNSNI